MRASSGSAGRQGDAAGDGQREQHRTPGAGARASAASSSAVSRSSSAEATTRLAPARSPGASRVMSDRRASTVTAVRGPATASSSRSRVAVVHHPVLRPGQPRREPAAHRAAAAAEVVDHEAAGRGEVPREALGELGRARRRVGRLAQVEPLRADPDGRRAHRAAPASDAGERPDVGGRPPGAATRAARARPGAGARAARRRRASAAARRRAPPGRRAGPAAPAGCRPPPCPSASVTPPTSVASTGTPRASASVTTMP